jgi:hypothetical protein
MQLKNRPESLPDERTRPRHVSRRKNKRNLRASCALAVVQTSESTTALRLFLGGVPPIFVQEVDANAKETFVIVPPHKPLSPIASAPLVYESREVFAGDRRARAFVFRCSQAEANRLFSLWLQGSPPQLDAW